MNKFILIVALLNVSVAYAVDDERIFEKGVKRAGQFFQGIFKEKTNKKDLPKVSDEKPMVQTRPMPIILQKEEKPAIVPEEIKNKELPKIEQEEKQSGIEKIKSAIVNNPKKITAGVLTAIVFCWMIYNAESSSSESQE